MPPPISKTHSLHAAANVCLAAPARFLVEARWAGRLGRATCYERLSFIYKRLPPLTASLFTNVCRLFLRLSEHVCRLFDTLPPEICRKIEIRGITPQTSLRRRPIVKNLASIALAIAVLCVANYAGAHETSGHNARTSHAKSITSRTVVDVRHLWHDHDKDSDTIWFNFAFEL